MSVRGSGFLSWGGEIELGLLAQHFDAELCVVSMEPLYLLPFPGAQAKHYLLYTGQHYDPLVGAATQETSVDDEVCVKLYPLTPHDTPTPPPPPARTNRARLFLKKNI